MKFTTQVDCPSYQQEITHVTWEITPEVINKLKAFGIATEVIKKLHPNEVEHVAFELPNRKLPGAFVGVLVKDDSEKDDDREDDDQPVTYGELVEFEFEDVFRITGYVDEGDAFSSALLHVSELAKLVEVGDANS